jgi:hypothetical protein
MIGKPDFAALRAKRDASLKAMFDAVCAEQGWDPATTQFHVSGADGCYCACPDGPCEHEFSGWREFEDGLYGEQVCRLCGMGAMAHDLRCAP